VAIARHPPTCDRHKSPERRADGDRDENHSGHDKQRIHCVKWPQQRVVAHQDATIQHARSTPQRAVASQRSGYGDRARRSDTERLEWRGIAFSAGHTDQGAMRNDNTRYTVKNSSRLRRRDEA
jgi:hypothetical protein